MFKAVKRFSEWLYKKAWPDMSILPSKRLTELSLIELKYQELTDPSNVNPWQVVTTKLTERTLKAVRQYTAEEYETYKHNPRLMEFVKEDLIRSFLPEISKRVEIRTDYNPCYKTARIEGRLTFWEEIK